MNSKNEKIMNAAFGYAFAFVAAIGTIAVITGHFQHIYTMMAGITLSVVFFKENKDDN